jgi:hypothetical protein
MQDEYLVFAIRGGPNLNFRTQIDQHPDTLPGLGWRHVAARLKLIKGHVITGAQQLSGKEQPKPESFCLAVHIVGGEFIFEPKQIFEFFDPQPPITRYDASLKNRFFW